MRGLRRGNRRVCRSGAEEGCLLAVAMAVASQPWLLAAVGGGVVALVNEGEPILREDDEDEMWRFLIFLVFWGFFFLEIENCQIKIRPGILWGQDRILSLLFLFLGGHFSLKNTDGN